MVYLGSSLHGPASTAAANSRASQRHFCATLLFTRRASNGDMPPISEFFLHHNIEKLKCACFVGSYHLHIIHQKYVNWSQTAVNMRLIQPGKPLDWKCWYSHCPTLRFGWQLSCPSGRLQVPRPFLKAAFNHFKLYRCERVSANAISDDYHEWCHHQDASLWRFATLKSSELSAAWGVRLWFVGQIFINPFKWCNIRGYRPKWCFWTKFFSIQMFFSRRKPSESTERRSCGSKLLSQKVRYLRLYSPEEGEHLYAKDAPRDRHRKHGASYSPVRVEYPDLKAFPGSSPCEKFVDLMWGVPAFVEIDKNGDMSYCDGSFEIRKKTVWKKENVPWFTGFDIYPSTVFFMIFQHSDIPLKTIRLAMTWSVFPGLLELWSGPSPFCWCSFCGDYPWTWRHVVHSQALVALCAFFDDIHLCELLVLSTDGHTNWRTFDKNDAGTIRWRWNNRAWWTMMVMLQMKVDLRMVFPVNKQSSWRKVVMGLLFGKSELAMHHRKERAIPVAVLFVASAG